MKCDSEKIEGSEQTMPSGAICVTVKIEKLDKISFNQSED